MIALDASVVIALLDPNDPHHGRASELLAEHAAEGFTMHQLTLAEVLVGAVRMGRGSQRFDDLMSLGVMVHQASASEPLTLAELRASTGLKLPDCCVLAVALGDSLPLATFDEQLTQSAKALGVRALS